MKRFYSLALLLIGCLSAIFAQNGPTRRPDWTFEKPKTNGSETFYYHVEQATASTEREARNLALSQAFMQAAMRVGVAVDVSEISSAVASGGNLSVLSERYEIPISIVCSFPENRPDGSIRYWLLCQIAKRGGLIPAYEDFSDCYKFSLYNTREREKILRSNTRAITISAFIPGAGQMYKGQVGLGAAFLASEVVLFGGGTACYFLGQEQLKIMKASGTSYDDFLQAKKTKNIYDISMYTCFGLGAAIHIGNMIHAWFVQDRHLSTNVTFAPAFIPTNEYSTPSYAMGAGVQIKF